MSTMNQTGSSEITGRDVQTVAAATTAAAALETALYIATDVATGGMLTVAGAVVGIIVAAEDRQRRANDR